MGKKTVFYGDERYIRDLRYLIGFSELSRVICDDGSPFSEVYRNLLLEPDHKASGILFIFCKYDGYRLSLEADALGLKHGEDYVNGSELLHKLDLDLEEKAKDRKVFVWGTGKMGEHFFEKKLPLIGNVEIYGCVDSNTEMTGKSFRGRRIFSPDELIGDRNAFFIITTLEYYDEIKEYLIRNGRREDDDFIHMNRINRIASQMADRVIHDTPKYDFVCRRPFEFAEICKDGNLGCCCGLTGVTGANDSVYLTSFDNAWHSSVLKVVRLSIINGTYTFCNPVKCEYVYNNRYRLENGNEAAEESADEQADKYAINEDKYPRTVQFSFDKSCNLFCKSCRSKVYIAQGREKNKLEKFADRALKEIIPFIKRIKFAGGETCISDVYNRIIFNKDHGIEEIAILSNGKCMNADYISRLAERGYKKIDIVISMDGATKETAEKLRRGIDYDVWKKNMSELAELRRTGVLSLLGFTFVVQRDNYQEMKKYAEMCLGYNADHIRFSKLVNWGEFSEAEFTELSLTDRNGVPVEELGRVIKDDIFKACQVKLFRWIEWFK